MAEAANHPAPDPFAEASFLHPTLDCDIVMKGGITSGVIYPLAVCELAQTYRLHSVGGASAGAIAAAAAAAAEVGRQSKTATVPNPVQTSPAALSSAATGGTSPLPPGFLGLSRFPTLLSGAQSDGRSLLFHLFRPQHGARRLFALLTAGLDEVSRLPSPAPAGSMLKVAGRVLRGLVIRAKRRVLVGVLPGLVLAAVGVVGLSGALNAAGVGSSLLLTLVGLGLALVGVLVAALTAVVADLRQLPAQGFGISSGRGETDADLALTPWLYARLQELAGRPMAEPLTFGDLEKHDVVLKVMTTNLSRAQPMAMPWDDGTYFFDPAEFEALFGPTVAQAMVDSPPPLPTEAAERGDRERLLQAVLPKRPFPPADKLPIIVAARMSLSFPLLIAAVPLYTIDRADASSPVPLVNWFSDGGLTANLPVHFFDSPLPTRPTFAIDLADFSADRPRVADERQNSYLPKVTEGALPRRTASWTAKSPLAQLLAFGMSLVQTARGWVDEAALVMPGYRDRVVTVFQDPDAGEGGLNLAMPELTVSRLSTRGRFAAAKLVEQFGPTGHGWDNHRWIRFRTATAGLSDWFGRFEHGYAATQSAFYDDVLTGVTKEPSYPMTAGRLNAAQKRIEGLRTEIATWAEEPTDTFTEDRPLPPAVLRLVPPAG
ncbi:hypothetical protein [uncultured Friedmanniella sp.]|uniref:hypothetical protein n=1 Tax=uncultured Friedmanniella sp. TaxID=335381 RepID=UPI0035CB17FC